MRDIDAVLSNIFLQKLTLTIILLYTYIPCSGKLAIHVQYRATDTTWRLAGLLFDFALQPA